MKEALRNPHRRRILELLASRRSMTPKEIAEELRIGIPTVYYHLEVLGEYVRKTGKGEFSVTEKGLEAHRAEVAGSSPRTPGIYSAVSWLVARPWASVVVGVASLASELAVCWATGFVPLLVVYLPALDPHSLLVPYFVTSVAAIFLVLEGASYALSRRTGGELPLLAGVLASRLPLLLVLTPVLAGLDQPAAAVAFTAAAQLLSVYLLSVFLSLTKGIRQEKSLIVCLAVLYIGILVNSAI